MLELFHGVRIARGRSLVAAVRFRWTGRQRGLTRRRGGAQAGEMLFPTHRHVLFRTATAAVSRRRRCHRGHGRFVPVGDFPFVRFPFVVARFFRLYSYAVVVVVVIVVQLKRQRITNKYQNVVYRTKYYTCINRCRGGNQKLCAPGQVFFPSQK